MSFAANDPPHELSAVGREKVLGPEHPGTADGLNNLATLLLNQDDLAAAQPLYERALTIREKVLGPEHPGTATILNNLAKLLERQGDLAAARPLYEPALAIDEKVLGPEHLEVAAVLTNLAGYASKAELLFRRAITIAKTHPAAIIRSPNGMPVNMRFSCSTQHAPPRLSPSCTNRACDT
jgi:tetratricopeptide (TPR) repeat protein